jgi:hypothetical protein
MAPALRRKARRDVFSGFISISPRVDKRRGVVTGPIFTFSGPYEKLYIPQKVRSAHVVVISLVAVFYALCDTDNLR